MMITPVRVENLTSSASALASSISVLIRALQLQEVFLNSKSRSRERFDMISNMSNPALQVVLEGVNPGGSDAAGKENATAPIKPWGECNYLRKSGTLYFAHLWVTALIFWILALFWEDIRCYCYFISSRYLFELLV